VETEKNVSLIDDQIINTEEQRVDTNPEKHDTKENLVEDLKLY